MHGATSQQRGTETLVIGVGVMVRHPDLCCYVTQVKSALSFFLFLLNSYTYLNSSSRTVVCCSELPHKKKKKKCEPVLAYLRNILPEDMVVTVMKYQHNDLRSRGYRNAR